MTDNLRRYCAIKKSLKSRRITEPKKNEARHINTLAMIVAGVIGSQKCHLPAIAKKKVISVTERGEEMPNYTFRLYA